MKDAPDEVSAEVYNAPEIRAFVVNFPVTDLQMVATETGDAMTIGDFVAGTSGNDLFLVNGEQTPALSIQSGVATRLRICFAAILNELEISLGAGCQWELLAKDGITVNPAPRALLDGKLYFGPGKTRIQTSKHVFLFIHSRVVYVSLHAYDELTP